MGSSDVSVEKNSGCHFFKWGLFWFCVVVIAITSCLLEVVYDASSPPMEVDPLYPEHGLDVGIYWFGKGNMREKDDPNSPVNTYFDSTKNKLVVFSHGWAVNSVEAKHRETFNYKANDPKYGIDVDMADSLLDDGWNVGLFYWNQLADESDVTIAEDKIWTLDSAEKMRWKYNNLSYSTWDAKSNPNTTVAGLLTDSLYNVLKTKSNGVIFNEIRLVGHSLGNQVVVNVANTFLNNIMDGIWPWNYKIDRLALCDPYYSLESKPYLSGKTTGEEIFNIVKYLAKDHAPITAPRPGGAAVEFLKTSLATSWPWGDGNDALREITAFSFRNPTFAPFWDFGSKHRSASNMYFLSYATPTGTFDMGGRLVVQESTDICSGARTETDIVRSVMGNSAKCQQTEGFTTQTLEDDYFQKYEYQATTLGTVIISLFSYICGYFILTALIETMLGSCIRREPHIKHFLLPVVQNFVVSLLVLFSLSVQMFFTVGIYPRQLWIVIMMILFCMQPLFFVNSDKNFGLLFISHLYAHLVMPKTGLCSSFWYYVRRIIYMFVYLLPVAMLLTVPSNPDGDMSHHARAFIGINLTVYGIFLYAFSILLIMIASVQKKTGLKKDGVSTQCNSVFSPTGEYDQVALSADPYDNDTYLLVSDDVSRNSTVLGVWAITDFPHIIASLMLTWGIYFMCLDGFIGASCWMQILLSSAASITVTCVTLFDHAVSSAIAQADLNPVAYSREEMQEAMDRGEFSITKWFIRNWSLNSSLVLLFVLSVSVIIWLVVVLEDYQAQAETQI